MLTQKAAHRKDVSGPTPLTERANILAALHAFIKQRPGLEYGNYGDPTSYRSEMRAITRDRHDAEALLAAVGWRDSITAESLKAGFRAFSGRLTWTPNETGGGSLDYCTGQYFPTEYRKAVCAVLGTVLFDYARTNLGAKLDATDRPGDAIRKELRSMVGPRLQRRWCD